MGRIPKEIGPKKDWIKSQRYCERTLKAGSVRSKVSCPEKFLWLKEDRVSWFRDQKGNPKKGEREGKGKVKKPFANQKKPLFFIKLRDSLRRDRGSSSSRTKMTGPLSGERKKEPMGDVFTFKSHQSGILFGS